MTVHSFPESRRPATADGRAKATGADAPVADASARPTDGEGAALPQDLADMYSVLRAFERRRWDSAKSSAQGVISTGFGILVRVTSREAAIAFAEKLIRTWRDPDGAA